MKVTATIRSDDDNVSHEFDITSYLESLNPDELSELKEKLEAVDPPGSGSEDTDFLAYSHAAEEPEIDRILWYCGKAETGFCCDVEWDEFMEFYDSRILS
jgi:hypothetical protein